MSGPLGGCLDCVPCQDTVKLARVLEVVLRSFYGLLIRPFGGAISSKNYLLTLDRVMAKVKGAQRCDACLQHETMMTMNALLFECWK